MLIIVPLYRAPDWPPALHKACSRYEAALQSCINGQVSDLPAARESFGFQMLLLDMKRRPEIYAGR